MNEYGNRARTLPAPPGVVWDSLADPHRRGTRPWMAVLSDEVEPTVLEGERPVRLVWSSLWPSRPDDRILLDLTTKGLDTLLRFRLLTPHEPPVEPELRHYRYRINHLLYADLRYSYGQ